MAARKRIVVEFSSELHKWLLETAKAGDFENAAEYIRHVLATTRSRAVADEIEARLIAAEESGPARRMSPKDWDELSKRVEARIARSRRPRRKSA